MVTDRALPGPAIAYGPDRLAAALYRAALLEADRILRDDELELDELLELEATLFRIYDALRAPLE
jgi:hypothetical protein